MKNILGHLNPSRIHKMSQEELTDLFGQLKRRPRYVNAAPRTVKELTKLVVEEFGGDASLMWLDKPAGQVKATLLRVHGVGEGIANMAILLIEAAFGMRFPDLDRPRMDIKADVHTMRVLYRLGVAAQESEWAAMDAARRISPEFPGAIDGALWHIGRTWCFSNIPNCEDCCVQSVCAKVEV
ncbi:MAG: hypothetical protein KIS85_05470 [Anaerolineales bacterium]|nr:hypothetical protein [Anaerolineales bacterium]